MAEVVAFSRHRFEKKNKKPTTQLYLLSQYISLSSQKNWIKLKTILWPLPLVSLGCTAVSSFWRGITSAPDSVLPRASGLPLTEQHITFVHVPLPRDAISVMRANKKEVPWLWITSEGQVTILLLLLRSAWIIMRITWPYCNKNLRFGGYMADGCGLRCKQSVVHKQNSCVEFY